MKKKIPTRNSQPTKAKTVAAARPGSDLSLAYILLVLAYIVIPVVTPNFYTLDSAGPKFLALSLLNMIAFAVLMTDQQFRNSSGLRSGFFRSSVGLAYSLLMIMTLLSFTKAININEAILNFIKAITVFGATYVLYVIFKTNKKYILWLAAGLTLLLLYDSLTVIYHMALYALGEVESVYDIKSVYSHRNVLASALFVKLPAALYLMYYGKGWHSVMAYFSVAMAVLGTLLLSTRAFYLGMALLVVALVVFAFLRYLASGKKGILGTVGIWVAVFVIFVGGFMVVQKYFFTRSDATLRQTISVTERISSIRADESSVNARLGSWKRSLQLIAENPVLGVGTGNWKVEVLKLENPTLSNFIYMFKNHNDFLEIAAETGIPGGLAFLAIFVMILYVFIRSSLKAGPDDQELQYLFLPAFGILAYSVDAFFNFPADRPEIQALFAMYVGMAAAFSAPLFKSGDEAADVKKSPGFPFRQLLMPASILVFAGVSLLLYTNARSLRYQRYVKEDLNQKIFKHTFAEINAGYPSFPDLTINGEPVAVNKARYLLNENRNPEAIAMLLPDQSSPYDTRREYFLAMAYDKMGKRDSAIFWISKVYSFKPKNSNAGRMLSSLLWDKGDTARAVQIIDSVLLFVKDSPDAWLQAANFQLQKKNYKKAKALLEDALKYLPGDTTIKNPLKKIDLVVKRSPYEAIYSGAVKAYSQKRYAEAVKLLNDFISKEPGLAEAYQIRAYCNYYLNNYEQSINDINKLFSLGEKNDYLLSLRGINFRSIGKYDQACADFKLAAENGNPDGISNFGKYCGK